MNNLSISPWRAMIPVGLGTSLSLIGDTSLYAVLPTHTTEAGVAIASLGILLSANRFIRLVLNGPVGLLYDRFPRRALFVPALFIGALSTALYALTIGFWPLLLGRLLWGLAWAGIWVGGNIIILDISQVQTRGRWIGIYQTFFFLGASGGAILGGFLTDGLGYHWAMGIGASLTLLGAVIALLFLPETRNLRSAAEIETATPSAQPTSDARPHHWAEMASAISLLGVNRLVVAGVLLSTFGLFLSHQLGSSIRIFDVTLGVATLTGIALGANSIIAMVSAPLMGHFSDRTGNRWQMVAGGLVPGIAGFSLLTLLSPVGIFIGIPLAAISGGSNQGLSTALVGDMSTMGQRGRRMGVLFTIGDLTSAVGPPLAYGALPFIDLNTIYLLCSGVLGFMLLVSLWWMAVSKRSNAMQQKLAHGIDQ